MEFFSNLLASLPGAVAQGLIWGLMAIGVYITFKVLDLAESVEYVYSHKDLISQITTLPRVFHS